MEKKTSSTLWVALAALLAIAGGATAQDREEPGRTGGPSVDERAPADDGFMDADTDKTRRENRNERVRDRQDERRGRQDGRRMGRDERRGFEPQELRNGGGRGGNRGGSRGGRRGGGRRNP